MKLQKKLKDKLKAWQELDKIQFLEYRNVIGKEKQEGWRMLEVLVNGGKGIAEEEVRQAFSWGKKKQKISCREEHSS